MSRPRSSQSVALFPFLAVLVCTMGSLIFLLLVTTRMLRNRVTSPPIAVVQPPPQLPLLSIESPDAAEPSPSSTPLEFLAETADPEAAPEEPPPNVRAVALEERQRELAALAARWQDRVNDLNEIRDERARLRSQRQQLQHAAAKRVAAMQSELRELEVKVGSLTGELSASATGTGTARQRIELETQIKELKRRLRAAQQADENDNSKFEVVPFDVVSGTSRRPILIECTSTGIRFIPEDLTITKEDLAGFNPHVNPLLVGASVLSNYWTAWNVRQPNPSRQPEPYVLLLVRPSGTVAYYVAMNMLRDLKQPHGYELIDEETELQLPELDAGAKAALEAAVKRLIADRDQVLRAAGLAPVGTGRGGRPGGGVGGAGGVTARPPGAGGEPTAGGGGPRDNSTGSQGTNGSGPRESEQFELTDIMAKDDVGGQSWERVENFEGPPRRNATAAATKSPAAQGKPSAAQAKPSAVSAKNGLVQKPGGNTRHGTGAGSGNSSNQFAVTAGGAAVEDPTGNTSRPPNAAKPGTVPGEGGASADSGIESLEESNGDESSMEEGSPQPGTNTRSDIGLGSSGKRSIPVEDHRGQKRKSSDRDALTEPEQLAHRHWGLSDPGAVIGLERELRVDVEPKRYVIGRKHAVAIDEADGREDSFAKIVTVLDLQARDWGKPPQGFFWKPSLRFVIADGGDANYERVHSLLERAGLSSTREYVGEHAAERAEKPKVLEPTPAHTPAPAAPKPQRRFFRGIFQ